MLWRWLYRLLCLGLEVMVMLNESDFEPGHPKRFDYDPDSREALEWARKNVHPRGERDYPVDHPKAVDTPGNTNAVEWLPGVDPHHPELEPYTGRTRKQAEAAREAYRQAAATAQDTPPRKPVDVVNFYTLYRDECERLGVRELNAEQYRALLARIES